METIYQDQCLLLGQADQVAVFYRVPHGLFRYMFHCPKASTRWNRRLHCYSFDASDAGLIIMDECNRNVKRELIDAAYGAWTVLHNCKKIRITNVY